MMVMEYTIKTIEAGYAKVYREDGRFLGSLCETKEFSSTRTGTDWVALTASKRHVGTEQTRQAAADKLIQWNEELNSKRRTR